MNRDTLVDKSSKAPVSVPAPVPPKPVSKPAPPATPPANTVDWNQLAKEWGAMNRDTSVDKSSRAPVVQAPPAPMASPVPKAVNPPPPAPPAPSNGVDWNQLAKEWGAMNRDTSVDKSSRAPSVQSPPAPKVPPVPQAAVAPAPAPKSASTSSKSVDWNQLAKEWGAMNRDLSVDKSSKAAAAVPAPAVPPPAPKASVAPAPPASAPTNNVDWNQLAKEWGAMNRDSSSSPPTQRPFTSGSPPSTSNTQEASFSDDFDLSFPGLEDLEREVTMIVQSLEEKEREHQATVEKLTLDYRSKESELVNKLAAVENEFSAFKAECQQKLDNQMRASKQNEESLQKIVSELKSKLDNQQRLTQEQATRADEYLSIRRKLETQLAMLQEETAAAMRESNARFEAEKANHTRELAAAQARLVEFKETSQSQLREAEQKKMEEVQRVSDDFSNKLQTKASEIEGMKAALATAEKQAKEKDAKIKKMADANASLKKTAKDSIDLLTRIKANLARLQRRD